MADFLMPSLGADMDAGTLVSWRIKPGDSVSRGQIVAEVETQKGIIEIESFQEGLVRELVVAEGATVPVGAVLARIGDDTVPGAATGTGPTPATAAPPGQEQRASPAARKRARELSVSLAQVVGSGPHGAITLADVEMAAGAAKPAPRQATPASGRSSMRRAIAAVMTRANAEIPHYYLATDVDMSAAHAFLERENAGRPVETRILPGALLVKAVAEACREVPELNGFWVDGGFRAASGIHVGFAIALRGGGLVAPAIKDADAKDISTISAELSDLILRSRRGGLRSSEMSDPSITLTSLGDRGVETVWGVIYPPQVAIVGCGRTTPRPCVVDGAVVARPLLTVTLAGDHRATDGHEGAAALAVLRRTLETWP